MGFGSTGLVFQRGGIVVNRTAGQRVLGHRRRNCRARGLQAREQR